MMKDDRHNNEPRTTLEIIDKALEVLLRNFVECVLFKKNEMSKLWILSSSFNEAMLVMRVEWLRVSNALEKSRTIRRTNLSEVKREIMTEVR